jgi:hypothetical protein
MKTSEAEQNGWKCPKCGGKTSNDVQGKGFVRHLERFVPMDKDVPTNEQGLCRYGREELDDFAQGSDVLT